MMDSASLVVTALILLTIILQIVCIVLVLDLKKNRKSEPIEEKPVVPEQRDFRRQREPDNRFGKRSPQEHKPKPLPAQSQNGDQLERSLRDINLRLKNADKDQEKERQRIKDTISPSSSPSTPSSPRRFDNQRPPRERGDNFRRNDRSRQDYQQNRPGPGDGPRGPREDRPSSRNQFEGRDRDRRPQGNFQQNPSPAPAAFPAAPVSAPAPMAAAPIVAAPIVPIWEASVPSVPVMEKAPVEQVVEAPILVQESRENLQHGRKFPVKRRALNLEEELSNPQGESATQDLAGNPASVASEKQFSEQAQEQNGASGSNASESSDGANESLTSGPISFGR